MTALDPFDPDQLEDPYDLYARLRDTDPVHEIPGMGLYLVSRHADVVEAAGRKQDFSSHLTAFVQRGAATGSRLVEVQGESAGVVDVLATADPPDHTRQRKVVSGTFRRIETAEPMIADIVDEMVDAFVSRGGGNWVDEVAGRLPVRVIAQLLGLPTDDVGRLKTWSDDGVELLSGVASDERMAECAVSVFGFIEYLRGHLAGASSLAPDGVLALLADTVDRGDLSGDEATSMALQLVSAGSDSTGNLIGSAARLLATHPDIQDRLRADEGLIPRFLEEVVRLESPFRGHFRVATGDTTLAGVDLVAGSRLFLIWASANRDPQHFESPDEVRLDRENPRAHLGFGWGIHKCLGAPLARLEARLVMTLLIRITSAIHLDPTAPPPAHVPSLLVRRPAHLHLIVEPA